ncbi:MAG: helix-turn-helix transcriptional regulator, partial [Terracidiphilus sp.]
MFDSLSQTISVDDTGSTQIIPEWSAHMEKILRLPEVKAATGKSRSSIYQGMADGSFPRPVALGARAIGWRASDIESWLQSLRGKNETAPALLAPVREARKRTARLGNGRAGV